MKEKEIIKSLKKLRKRGFSLERLGRETGFSSWTIRRWVYKINKMSQAAITVMSDKLKQSDKWVV